LCDDVGLGKSVQMLTLMKLHPLRLNLLVAPKATIEQWLGYIEKWLPEAYAVKGGGKDTEKRLAEVRYMADKGTTAILVCTYGALIQGNAYDLFGVCWDRIVLDECHYIKNPLAQTTKAANNLVGRIRWGCSATPLQNGLSDFVSLVSWLKLKDKKPRGQMDMNWAHEIKARYVLSRKKEDVRHTPALKLHLKDPIIFTNESLLSQEEATAYRILHAYINREAWRVKNNSRGSNKGGVVIQIRSLLMRLMQFVASPAICIGYNEEMLKLAERHPEVEAVRGMRVGTKINNLCDMMCASGRESRSVVFCQFIAEIETVTAALKQRGMNVETYVGSTLNRDRESILRNAWLRWDMFCFYLREFDLPTEILLHIWSYTVSQVLVIQIRAGGVGINLTGFDRIYITTQCWNPCVEHQAIGRANRIGQTNEVKVIRMTVRLPDQEEEEEGGKEKEDVLRPQKKRRLHSSLEEDRIADADHDTIDQRILTVQNGKRKLIKELGTVSPKGGTRKISLTLEEMLQLLS